MILFADRIYSVKMNEIHFITVFLAFVKDACLLVGIEITSP